MSTQDLLNFFLPSNILENFEVVNVKMVDKDNEVQMQVHLDEKMNYPENYSAENLTSKGFSRTTRISDFPIRDKAVVLIIRRRVWVDNRGNTIFNKYDFCHVGTRYTQEFSAFLKEQH